MAKASKSGSSRTADQVVPESPDRIKRPPYWLWANKSGLFVDVSLVPARVGA